MTESAPSAPVLVLWGTYDVGKPRVRLLIEAARELGYDVVQCHAPVWTGVEDKSQLKGLRAKLARILRLVASYPKLWREYLRAPSHDAVLVPYPGQLDVMMLLPLAKLRSAKLVWDVFMSTYDTVVLDRGLLPRGSPWARAIYAWEWMAARAADGAFLDTRAHGNYFAELFGLPPDHVGFVFVGAEATFSAAPGDEPRPQHPGGQPPRVLFYGQFIPLQGVEVIVRAAGLLQQRGTAVRFDMVGVGQQSEMIDHLIEDLGITNIDREDWVPYEQLPELIRHADLALGVFGESRKAISVIPNKVFQILAVGQKLVTADTPALRELVVGDGGDGVWLVPPGDPTALADAVCTALESEAKPPKSYRFGRAGVAAQLRVALERIA